MTIYDDYIEYCNTYITRFGPDTVVLMQIGDFFELYGVQNEAEVVGADMYRVAGICNLIVSRKNKSVLDNSRQNPLMMGFPLYAIQKQSQALVQAGFTVVIIRQVTPPPDVKREVTEVLSPSTLLAPANMHGTGGGNGGAPTGYGTHLMVGFFERHGNILGLGLAFADLSTGRIFIKEAIRSGDMDDGGSFALDELVRVVSIFPPAELLLTTDSGSSTQTYWKDIRQTCKGLCSKVHDKLNAASPSPTDNILSEATKMNYQTEVFRRAFPEDTSSLLSVHEILQVERRPMAAVALVHLLQFIYEHNEQLLWKIQLPIAIEQAP